MPNDAIDTVDGLPRWSFQPGEPIHGGNLAWARLGTGLRCEAWLAWSTEWWVPVVLKLARPHQVADARARLALGREADALAQCVHPSFPRLLSDGRASARPHLIQEYVDGLPLDEVMGIDGPFDPGDAVVLVAQVAAAVRYLHRRGLAHVDLKPANVVMRDGRPVVIDLGSARPLGGPQPLLGAAPIGSAGYAAPELERGAPIAVSMDIYALGILLVEALTGRTAFDPALAAFDRPDPAGLDFPDGTPDGVATFGRALLHADPDLRPGTTDEVLAGLLGCLAPSQRPRLWPTWTSPGMVQGDGPGSLPPGGFAAHGTGYVSGMTDGDRAKSRAARLLSEEAVAGSEDPLRQAEVILEESDEREEHRDGSPSADVEHRRSEDTVPPVD